LLAAVFTHGGSRHRGYERLAARQRRELQGSSRGRARAVQGPRCPRRDRARRRADARQGSDRPPRRRARPREDDRCAHRERRARARPRRAEPGLDARQGHEGPHDGDRIAEDARRAEEEEEVGWSKGAGAARVRQHRCDDRSVEEDDEGGECAGGEHREVERRAHGLPPELARWASPPRLPGPVTRSKVPAL